MKHIIQKILVLLFLTNGFSTLVGADPLDTNTPFNLLNPKTINIFSEPPVGRFGDVASNLIMAELISIQYPQTQINIIYSRTAEDVIAKLANGFNKELYQQTLGRFTFYNLYYTEHIPPADILFQFSSENVVLEKVKNSAPVNMVFSEFGRNEIFDQSKEAKGQSALRVTVNNTHIELILPTGINNGGIYLSQAVSHNQYPDEFLVSVINKLAGLKISVEAFNSAEIGFAYVSRGQLTNIYNQAIFKIANQEENKNKLYLLFSKAGFYNQFENKPNNVIFFPTNNFPLALSREIIVRSTLPIFVTGDGSLNFAVDAAKPFFYELENWKIGSIKLVQDAIEKLNPKLSDFLNNGFHIKAEFQHKDLAKYQQFFVEAIENKNLIAQYQSALVQIRRDNSLVENITKKLKRLQKTLNDHKVLLSKPSELENLIRKQFIEFKQPGLLLCRELNI